MSENSKKPRVFRQDEADRPRKRIVTLTDRAPIRIVEDEWPELAQGTVDGEYRVNEVIISWEIDVRVRHKVGDDGGCIVQARCVTDDGDAFDQRIRVGHLLQPFSGDYDELYDHILEVGDELRERIRNDHVRGQVTHAIDRCFANLPAEEY